MKRSNICYGWATWMVGWTAGCLIHSHPMYGFLVGVVGYGILVLTSKEK